MSNISGNINLAAFKHAFLKTKKGAEGIFIPFEVNNITKTDKGNVYVNIQASEHINAEKKQTHIVGQSVPKDVYEKLKEAGEYAPTLGNLTDWAKLGGGEATPGASSEAKASDFEEGDDLPF